MYDTSSLVIETLFKHCASNSSFAIAYVYFNKTDQEAQSVSALLRSLTAQFLRQTTYTHQALLHIYNESYENKKHVPFSTYVAAFRELMTVFAKTYIVIDAVNECWTKEKLLDFLQEIMGWQLPSNHVCRYFLFVSTNVIPRSYAPLMTYRGVDLLYKNSV